LTDSSEVLTKNQDVLSQHIPEEILKSLFTKREQNTRRFEREKEEPRKRVNAEFMTRHDRSITCACYDAVNESVYTSSKDKYIIEWKFRRNNLEAVRTLAGHEGSVWCVDTTQEGIVSGAADGYVCIFSPSKNKISRPRNSVKLGGVVKSLHNQPSGIAVSGDKLGSTPHYLVVLDHNLREIWRTSDFPTKINAVLWGPEGQVTKVISGHEDGRMLIWNGLTGAFLTAITRHVGPIWSLSRCDHFITSSSQDKTACVSDFSSREVNVHRRVTSNRPLRSCVYDGVDCIVYAGGREPREVTRSNLLEDEFEVFVKSGEETIMSSKAHFGPIHRLLFASASGGPSDCFFSISEDGCLKCWSTYDANLIADDKLG